MSYPLSLKHRYPFQNGADLLDDVIGGATFDATIVGSLTTDTSVYKYGDASLKDFGNSNYLTLPKALCDELGTESAWSLGMWIKEPAAGAGYQINSYFGFLDGVPGGNYETSIALNISTDTTPWKYRIYCNGVTVGGSKDGSSYTSWTYISLEWDGTNCKFYAGGVLIATHASALNPFSGDNTGRTLRIGREYYAGDYYRGNLDEVMISNVATLGIEPVDTPITVTNVNPATGPTSGGTLATLTGTTFQPGATIDFAGDPATEVTWVSGTSMTCRTPAHVADDVDVTVTNPDLDTGTMIDGYEYIVVAPASIFEKNKLATDSAWLILLEVTLADDTVVRLCRNTEDITWRGVTWSSFPLDINDINDNSGGEIPNIVIRISNVTRLMSAYLEDSDGAAGITIKVYIINSDFLADEVPAWEGTFAVLNAVLDTQWAMFTCGLDYPLTSRRPMENYQKYVCPFDYGGIRCGVSAATQVTYPTCTKTLAQCQQRSNEERFGAELSIPGGYYG